MSERKLEEQRTDIIVQALLPIGTPNIWDWQMCVGSNHSVTPGKSFRVTVNVGPDVLVDNAV